MNRGHKAFNMPTFAEIYRLSHSRVQRELGSGFRGVLLCDGAHGGLPLSLVRSPKIGCMKHTKGEFVCYRENFRFAPLEKSSLTSPIWITA